jgi:hypothetical protein
VAIRSSSMPPVVVTHRHDRGHAAPAAGPPGSLTDQQIINGKSRLIHLRCQYQPALHAGCMRAFDLAALPSYSLWESSYSLWESSAAYGGAVDLPVGRSSPGPGKRTRDTACGLAGRARSRPLAVAAHLIKFPRRFSVRRPCWCPGIRTGHGPVQGRLSPGG